MTWLKFSYYNVDRLPEKSLSFKIIFLISQPKHLLTFSKLAFPKILSGALSECQTVWIQIRTDILSVLIWVETVSQPV